MFTPLVFGDGEKIRQLRTGKGWSTAQLAENAGIGRTSVWYIENNLRGCKAFVLVRVANALGVTAEDITAPEQDRKSA
jgi:transcriptional regulator with XRE-family HTH domain